MFETIKTKTIFSKEEIKELIDKYVDTCYVSVDVKPERLFVDMDRRQAAKSHGG